MLPPRGPAVPGLPVGRLQVCLRVPRLPEWPQPRVGRHQVSFRFFGGLGDSSDIPGAVNPLFNVQVAAADFRERQ